MENERITELEILSDILNDIEESSCNECDSLNTYTSVATAYNTVLVCKDCGHEEHTPMDNKNTLDLYNEMLEAQEADMEARGLMDAPDSFQIAGITEEELEEEYTEENAIRDFCIDPKD